MPENFFLSDFIAGWIGGISGLVVGHPLDTLKVRQQTLKSKDTSVLPLIKNTYKNEGVRGFYKGLFYPLLTSGAYNSIFFGSYGNSLTLLQNLQGEQPRRKMCCEGPLPGKYWHLNVGLAGCIAGTITVIVGCPVEIVKIKLQQQAQPHSVSQQRVYKGAWDVLSGLYRDYGLRNGLFRGVECTFWRDVPTFGIYMLSYEHVLCYFKDEQDRSSHTSILSQIVSGGIAGVLSWVLVIPLDVIKTRLQADDFSKPLYTGTIDCAKKCYKEGGLPVLFRGSLLMTIRAFPVTAAVFVGYEFMYALCS